VRQWLQGAAGGSKEFEQGMSGMKLGKARNGWETSPGRWAYSFTVKGQRHTGTYKGPKRDFERFLRDEKERVKGDHVAAAQANGGHGVRDLPFADAVDKYFDEVGQYAKAAKEDERHLHWLCDQIGDDTLITKITDPVVARVVAKKRAQYRHGKPHLGRVSSAYVNRTTTDLIQRVLNRARKTWKIPLPDEPDWAEHLLAEKVRVREMSYQEEAVLEQQAREDYRRVIQFTELTGLRKMNVVDLLWTQVDWVERVIKVRTKGGHEREIAITEGVAVILQDARGHHPTRVFTYLARKTWTNSKSGKCTVANERYPITKAGYESAWRALKREAGVRNLTIQDLRKTRGSRIVRATGNLAAASKALGHASIAITAKHYAHITPEDVVSVLEITDAVSAAKRAKLKAVRDADSQKNLKSSGEEAA
jgi:integrase